jgi:hypothetical protein
LLTKEDFSEFGFSLVNENDVALTFERVVSKKSGELVFELTYLPEISSVSLKRTIPDNNIIIMGMCLFSKGDLDFALNRSIAFKSEVMV